ncbi:hypothetical protein ASF05_03150 [Aeromicrobium sp. Leaf245]|nr:hypothetical protein ASF05_03150 [Aeromicrobium sp. Leaf245]
MFDLADAMGYIECLPHHDVPCSVHRVPVRHPAIFGILDAENASDDSRQLRLLHPTSISSTELL